MKLALRDVGDAGKHVGEPSQRIDVIELGRLCRLPNYAEWFGEEPVVCTYLGLVEPDVERHLDAAQDRGTNVVEGDLEPGDGVSAHAATLRCSIVAAQFQGSS